MAFSNEEHRNRYADDPEYRARKLAENKAWREANREELIADWHEKWATDDEFRQRQQAKSRTKQLRKYGLTPADYGRMEAAQNGGCLICGRKARQGRYLCVDHCHLRLVVRGLLCDPCNKGLGSFQDNAERMRVGADYLDCANGVPLPPCRRRAADGALAGWCVVRPPPEVRSTIVMRCETGRFGVGGAALGSAESRDQASNSAPCSASTRSARRGAAVSSACSPK